MALWRSLATILVIALFAPPAKTLALVSGLAQRSQIQELDNLKLKTEGPNCWNAALMSAGLARSIRFVSKGEYWFWMQSKYCRALSEHDTLQSGDLGSLTWSGHGHYHSFVFDKKDKVFSKTSPSPKFPYRLQTFEEMFSSPNKAWVKNCLPLKPSGTNKGCAVGIAFHRCLPIENNFFESSSELASWDLKLKSIEQFIALWAIGSEKATLDQYEKTIYQLYRILRQIQEKKSAAKDQLIKFKYQAIEYRTLGLILSDVGGAKKAPKVYPYLNYAYQVQDNHKK